MATLNVVSFSCLKDIRLSVGAVNIIIGAQGSGKSVTTKLIYFFNDLFSMSFQCAERGLDIDDFKKFALKHFSLIFPPVAWGQGRFIVTYAAGSFTVRIMRRLVKGRVTDEATITFSEWFHGYYESAVAQFDDAKSSRSEGSRDSVRFEVDRNFELRRQLERSLLTELGENYFDDQTFIPAGRAFFTSLGKIVAGLDSMGGLDPIAIRFARQFAAMRSGYYSYGPRISKDFSTKRKKVMNSLFGGTVIFDRDDEYIEMADGRRIPPQFLSSGQQELLPMWVVMDLMSHQEEWQREFAKSRREKIPKSLLFIEEPEAHLFPSAQYLLLSFLIGTIRSTSNRRSLIMTTHSPYIMSILNVYLKAGQLGRRKALQSNVEKIVPKECWLEQSEISAYALSGGELRSLMIDGLIDAQYLDSVSDDIARLFSKLLLIEAGI
jgi:hypothetical protein